MLLYCLQSNILLILFVGIASVPNTTDPNTATSGTITQHGDISTSMTETSVSPGSKSSPTGTRQDGLTVEQGSSVTPPTISTAAQTQLATMTPTMMETGATSIFSPGDKTTEMTSFGQTPISTVTPVTLETDSNPTSTSVTTEFTTASSVPHTISSIPTAKTPQPDVSISVTGTEHTTADVTTHTSGSTQAVPSSTMVSISSSSEPGSAIPVTTDTAMTTSPSDTVTTDGTVTSGASTRNTTENSQTTVTRNTTENSQTTVTGDPTVNSQTTVTRDTTENSQITVTGDPTVNSLTTVTRDTTENSQTTVTSDTTENSLTTVTRDTTENSQTTVTRDTTENSLTTVTRDTTENSLTTVTRDTTENSLTTVTRDTTENSQITVTGDPTVNSQTTVTGDTTENSLTTVTRDTTENSLTTVTGDTTENSLTTVTRDTTENSQTTVTEETTVTPATGTTAFTTSPPTSATTGVSETSISTGTSSSTETAGSPQTQPPSTSTATSLNTTPGPSTSPSLPQTTVISQTIASTATASSSTPGGETTTTESNQSPGQTTGSGITDITTAASPGTSQAPSRTTLPPPTPAGSCPANPCPTASICLEGACQCLSGYYLSQGRCIQAQVFPGVLHLVSLTFEKEMSNRSSVAFRTTAAKISKAMSEALSDQPGFVQTDVVQLESGSVRAKVSNVFQPGSEASQASTDGAIQKAIMESAGSTSLLSDATFTLTSLCDQDRLTSCDVHTTYCEDVNGMARCKCKSGYISNLPYSNLSCKACPSGQRAERDKCQLCSFGYSGFNCSDSSLLAVVVISCVLGGVLLIIVLAFLTHCYRRRCSTEKSDFISSSSPYAVEDFQGPWPGQGLTIPRATTNWDPVSMEMTEGGSTHALVEPKPQTNGGTGSYDITSDSMNTFKGKNPSRYSYLVQGHENPYFIPGDERRTS